MAESTHAPRHAAADEAEDTSLAAADRPTSILRRLRAWFRHFRRSRPFWGSLLLIGGAYFIAFPMIGAMTFLTTVGARALTPLLLGGGMIAAALVAMFAPKQRHFPALVAAMLSVASLPLANLGGWLIGMILGIVGSSMIFGWTPYTDKQLTKYAERDALRTQRRAIKHARRHSGDATD